jgi:hypothetical protein
VGPISGGAVAGALGLDTVYVCVAALLLTMACAQFFLLRDPSRRPQPSAAAEGRPAQASERLQP